jgi:multisubunit Na+/H+ antiporter MnhF subunit
VIVIAVVVAMVATLLFPVIVRIVRPPRARDIVIAIHAEASWHRMVP